MHSEIIPFLLTVVHHNILAIEVKEEEEKERSWEKLGEVGRRRRRSILLQFYCNIKTTLSLFLHFATHVYIRTLRGEKREERVFCILSCPLPYLSSPPSLIFPPLPPSLLLTLPCSLPLPSLSISLSSGHNSSSPHKPPQNIWSVRPAQHLCRGEYYYYHRTGYFCG